MEDFGTTHPSHIGLGYYKPAKDLSDEIRRELTIEEIEAKLQHIQELHEKQLREGFEVAYQEIFAAKTRHDEQVAQLQKQLGEPPQIHVGRLVTSVEGLTKLLGLPEGVKVVSVQQDHLSRQVYMTLVSLNEFEDEAEQKGSTRGEYSCDSKSE